MGLSVLIKTLVFATAVVAVLGDPPSRDTTAWTVNFVQKHGYTIETHTVTTEDGYILTLHHMPSTKGQGGKPVLLHHGFLGRSADFVVLGPQKSLAFILADKGYDVWMANARGTTESKRHTSLSSRLFRYWDFTWHEVGYYDIAAEIDYILDKTGYEKLTYVGFSMGTSAFFALASTRPEYQNKVDKMIALGPVAYMSHVRGPVLKYIAPLLAGPRFVTSTFGNGEFLPTNAFMSYAAQRFCANDSRSQRMCSNVLFLFMGFNDELNGDMTERIFEYSPSGGSVKELLHFGQLVGASRRDPAFRQFDHGRLRNLRVYGQLSPPDYQVSKISIPIHLFIGKNDWFAAPEDVETLSKKLPNVVTKKLLGRETFNHFDFVYGPDVKETVYDDVVQILEK